MTTYLLQVAICWGLFLGLYHLTLRKETFFVVNRAYLLLTIILGLLIPRITWDTSMFMEEPTVGVAIEYMTLGFEQMTAVVSPAVEEDNTLGLLAMIYWTGVLLMIGKIIYGIGKIMWMRRGAQLTQEGDQVIAYTQRDHAPFTFFGTIYLSKVRNSGFDSAQPSGSSPEQSDQKSFPERSRREQLQAERSRSLVLIHESAHVSGWHTLDVLFIELVKAFFWFNPLVYGYDHALKTVHEYIADANVLQRTALQRYGRLLLRQAQPGLEIALANHFYNTQLKKRFKMMTRTPSQKRMLLKYLTVIPFILIVSLVFSNQKVQAEISKVEDWDVSEILSSNSDIDFNSENFTDSDYSQWSIAELLELLKQEFQSSGSSVSNKMASICTPAGELYRRYQSDKSIAIEDQNISDNQAKNTVLLMKVTSDDLWFTIVSSKQDPIMFSGSKFNNCSDLAESSRLSIDPLDMVKKYKNHPSESSWKKYAAINDHLHELLKNKSSDQKKTLAVEINRYAKQLGTDLVAKYIDNQFAIGFETDYGLSFLYPEQKIIIDTNEAEFGFSAADSIRYDGRTKEMYFLGNVKIGSNEEISGDKIDLLTRHDIDWNPISKKPLVIAKTKQPFELVVLNQFGEKVFSDKAYTNDWTGLDVNDMILKDGTYYYSAKMNDNHSVNGYLNVVNLLPGTVYIFADTPKLIHESCKSLSIQEQKECTSQKQSQIWNKMLNRYPAEALKDNAEGMIHLDFIVEKDGSISNIESNKRFGRTYHPALEADAIERMKSYVRNGFAFTPAKVKENAVRYRHGMTFPYSLEEYKNPTRTESRISLIDSIPLTSEIFSVVEEMPQFPGGKAALTEYIQSNLIYPKEAKDNKIQGVVQVEFVIGKDSQMKYFKTQRDPGHGTPEEALRVLGKMASEIKWEPGKQRGRNVNVQMTLPITFALSPNFKAPEEQIIKRKVPGKPVKDANGLWWQEDTVYIYYPERYEEEIIIHRTELPTDYSNDKKEAEEEIFEDVEEMPQFPGGQSALNKYIYENLTYPKIAKDNHVKGQSIIGLIIEKDGSISSTIIRRDPGAGTGSAAQKMVDKMANEIKWKPGKQQGQVVRVLYNLPIDFPYELETEILSTKNEVDQSSDKNPLIVLFNAQGQSLYNLQGVDTDIINPNDIQKIQVLKGQKAINKYGKKAENGVIEIYMKAGKLEEPKSVQRKTNLPSSEMDYESIKIYPNPASTILTIDMVKVTSATKLLISSIDGKELLRHRYVSKLKGGDRNVQSQHDISSLPNGVLIISIIQGDKVYSQPIIKKQY